MKSPDKTLIEITGTDDLVAGVAVVANLLGVTERRVQQLAESRRSLRRARGSYDLRAVVMAYCEYLRDGFVDPDDKKTEADERTRLLGIKADIAELDRAERQGKLINAEAVRRQDFQLAYILKTNLLSIADRISALVAAEKDSAICHRLIFDEVNGSLQAVIESMDATEIDLAELDINRKAMSDSLTASEGKEVSQETSDTGASD